MTHWILGKQKSTLPHPPTKFQIGDEVIWAYVPAHDKGIIIGCAWTHEMTYKAAGWWYLVKLSPDSHSFDYCQSDWGFESDLQLLEEFNNKKGEFHE